MRSATNARSSRIEDLLIGFGDYQLDIGQFRDDQGALRLVATFPTWDDFLRLALDEVRYCGASGLQVMRRMNALINNLLEVLPATRHAALRTLGGRLQGTVERSFKDANEKQEAPVADRQGLGIGEEQPEDAK